MNFIKKILPFVLLFAFTLLLRINSLNFPYERDEGEYAYIAYFADKGVVPYRDVFDQKPPLIFLLFYLGETIIPGGSWGPRIIALVFTFTAALLLYFVGKKQFDRKVGYVAMWLFIAMLTIPQMTPFSANTEIFLLPFMVGGYLIFVNYQNSNKKLPWFIFGVLSSIAVMFKPICAPFLLFILILWIYKYYSNNRKFRRILLPISLTILGAVTVITPILIYLVTNNALKPFIDTVIIYNLHYSWKFQSGGFTRFVKVIIGLLVTFPPVFLITLIYFLNNSSKLWLYVGILCFLFLAIYNTPILHYYLIIIPFLALYASAGFTYLLTKYAIRYRVSWLLLTGLLVVLTASTNLKTILFSKDELFRKTYLPNPFLSSLEFSGILSKQTTVNDEVLMLGNEPQVLYYSKRMSASRFFYLYPTLITTAESKAYKDEYINNLLIKEPKYLVYSRYIASGIVVTEETGSFFEKINKIIQEKYEVVGGCTSDVDCGWTENVNLDRSNLYSYILLRKKSQ